MVCELGLGRATLNEKSFPGKRWQDLGTTRRWETLKRGKRPHWDVGAASWSQATAPCCVTLLHSHGRPRPPGLQVRKGARGERPAARVSPGVSPGVSSACEAAAPKHFASWSGRRNAPRPGSVQGGGLQASPLVRRVQTGGAKPCACRREIDGPERAEPKCGRAPVGLLTWNKPLGLPPHPCHQAPKVTDTGTAVC